MAEAEPSHPPRRAQRSLPAAADAARTARLWTRRVLRAWSEPVDVDTAETVVSELVANAVRHGRGTVGLCLQVEGGRVGVAVSDTGQGPVTRLDPAPLDEAGRGLVVVEHLSQHWGVDHHADRGITVWAILPDR